MRYLLSNGRHTEDTVTYIKDVIKINMLLLPDEIPYFSGGSIEFIADILHQNLESNIREAMTQVLDRVKLINSSVKIELKEILINDYSVTVRISINDIVENYEIKRFYKEVIS